MSVEPGIIDANVLVYAMDADAPQHALQTTHLLRRHPVTGGSVFDLQIVATMLANGINRIYTFNGDDFRLFSELRVVPWVVPPQPPCFLRREEPYMARAAPLKAQEEGVEVSLRHLAAWRLCVIIFFQPV